MSDIIGNVTDAGRSNSLANEKNDCTVRALAIAQGIHYMEAYGYLLGSGRKPRKRFAAVPIFTSLFGQPQPTPHMTVANYVQYIAHSGTWIIQITGHVFTVIDKTIHDMNPTANLNRHVVRSWRVK